MKLNSLMLLKQESGMLCLLASLGKEKGRSLFSMINNDQLMNFFIRKLIVNIILAVN